MSENVVFNRATYAHYIGRSYKPDGTVSDVFHVPVEHVGKAFWDTPPTYITPLRDMNKSIQARSSVIVSKSFDTIIEDPRDFSILRLLLSDLVRKISEPPEHMVKCWNLWEPFLVTVRENIGQEGVNEIARIRDEMSELVRIQEERNKLVQLRNALSEFGQTPDGTNDALRRVRSTLGAQRQFLRVLITAANRHTVLAAYRMCDHGPQDETRSDLEYEVTMGARTVAHDASAWIKSVLISVSHGNKDFIELASRVFYVYMVDLESGWELRKQFDNWLRKFVKSVRSHCHRILTDIASALHAFEGQLEADKRVSGTKQCLRPQLVAFNRSVGVMLDTGVRVRFGEVVQTLKSFYMQIIKVNPDTVSNTPDFHEWWSRIHNDLLKLLMLKDTFPVRAPSLADVNVLKIYYGVTLPSFKKKANLTSGPQTDLDLDDPSSQSEASEPLSEGRSDNESTEFMPDWKRSPISKRSDTAGSAYIGPDCNKWGNFSETPESTSAKIMPGVAPKTVRKKAKLAPSRVTPELDHSTTSKKKETVQDRTPTVSNGGKHQKAKDKWYKRILVRAKIAFWEE